MSKQESPFSRYIEDRFAALEIGSRQRKPLPEYTNNTPHQDILIYVHRIALALPCMINRLKGSSDELTDTLTYYFEKVYEDYFRDDLTVEDINRIHGFQVAIDTLLWKRAGHEPSYLRIQKLLGNDDPEPLPFWSNVGIIEGEYTGEKDPDSYYLQT